MTAVLHEDALPTLPAPPQIKRSRHPGAGDPLVDAAARLLSIPLRQVYAVLWRVGLIEVTA